MLKAFITAYPWDLIDNLDRALDRLHGEIGIQGINLWLATPPVQEIRVAEVRPRVLRDGGGLTFQPDGGMLKGTSWRPIVSDWARTREAVAPIVEACDRRDVAVRFVISVGEAGRIPLHHPETACVNALGAASVYGVCPFDPQVAGYVRAVMAEATRRWGKRPWVLHDLFPAWTDHEFGRWTMPPSCAAVERAALSVCFCESCSRIGAQGGVDVPQSRHQAMAIIDRCLHGEDAAAGLKTVLADAPQLTAYLARQWQGLGEILTQWSHPKVELLVRLRGSSTHMDATATPAFTEAAAAVVTCIDDHSGLNSAHLRDGQRGELELSPALYRAVGDAGLVTLLQEAVRLGFTGVDVGNIGVIPEARLDAVRKAVRFARRTSKD